MNEATTRDLVFARSCIMNGAAKAPTACGQRPQTVIVNADDETLTVVEGRKATTMTLDEARRTYNVPETPPRRYVTVRVPRRSFRNVGNEVFDSEKSRISKDDAGIDGVTVADNTEARR